MSSYSGPVSAFTSTNVGRRPWVRKFLETSLRMTGGKGVEPKETELGVPTVVVGVEEDDEEEESNMPSSPSSAPPAITVVVPPFEVRTLVAKGSW